MKNLFDVQGAAKLDIYVNKFNKPSIIGYLIRANYEAALIHLGIRGMGLFNIDYNSFQILLPQL